MLIYQAFWTDKQVIRIPSTPLVIGKDVKIIANTFTPGQHQTSGTWKGLSDFMAQDVALKNKGGT